MGDKDCNGTKKRICSSGLVGKCKHQCIMPPVWNLSEAMADTHVEIRYGENDTFSIIYRNYQIASVDALEQKLIERHIRRL